MQAISETLSKIGLAAPSPLTLPAPKSARSVADLFPNAACQTCHDVGRVMRADPDDTTGRSSKSAPCPKCGVATLARDLQSAYPLPDAWAAYDLAAFQPIEGEQRQHAHALRYAANPRGWLVLQGGPGTGKTVMLIGVLNALRARGKHVLFLPARTLGDLVYRALDPDAVFNLQRFERDLCYIDLLIIDEFDKLDWSKTFVHDKLFNILNWRYDHCALTAIAFNDDARIKEPSPAIYSRLRDGRWGDGRGSNTDDGIIRSTAEDVRPYLTSMWADN